MWPGLSISLIALSLSPAYLTRHYQEVYLQSSLILYLFFFSPPFVYLSVITFLLNSAYTRVCASLPFHHAGHQITFLITCWRGWMCPCERISDKEKVAMKWWEWCALDDDVLRSPPSRRPDSEQCSPWLAQQPSLLKPRDRCASGVTRAPGGH